MVSTRTFQHWQVLFSRDGNVTCWMAIRRMQPMEKGSNKHDSLCGFAPPLFFICKQGAKE